MLLKDCFFGPLHTIDAKLGQNTEQVAWKNGTIARKTEKKVFVLVELKIIENTAIINYSRHTAWIRKDVKQTRRNRYDGLAFIPDPRVLS